MAALVPPPSLRAVPGFDILSTAEASVFDCLVERRRYRQGDRIGAGGGVTVVAAGSVRLSLGPSIVLGREGEGGLVGDLELFAAPGQALEGVAETETTILGLDRRHLKTAFHRSRQAAAKLNTMCARSLARKIRLGNELLRERPAATMQRALDSAPVLRLGDLDRMRLRAFSAARDFGPGAVVFRQGDSGTELYVIEAGEVEVTGEDGSEGGRSIVRLGPGQFFGEMAFVDRSPRSATVRATSELRVRVLPAPALDGALESSSGFALYLTHTICKVMARRLSATLTSLAAT